MDKCLSPGDRIKVKLANGEVVNGTFVAASIFCGDKVYDFYDDENTRRYAFPEQIEKFDG